MSTWTLELWVEGPTDASRGPAGDLRGVLPPIVLRTLQELSGFDVEVFDAIVPRVQLEVRSFKIETREAVGFGGGRDSGLDRFAKKVLQAFRKADARADRLVVAVFDVDHGADAALRVKRRDMIANHLIKSRTFGRVPAVCVQEVEAWLLADFTAVSRHFPDIPGEGWPQNPEDVRNPKEHLKALLGNPHDSELTKWFAPVAEAADLELLAARCPEGYGKFRTHANQLLMPSILGE